MLKVIIEHFILEAEPYVQMKNFSSAPGIYALFFIGNKFPLPDYSPKKNEIIYIGKTLTSQASRDRDTHFKSGKTGSSTLRRSFGALLKDELKLKPIPRGQADIDKKRYSHYKFDLESEERLTAWMIDNLGLSFYAMPEKSPSDIDALETALIHELTPTLNLDRKNPFNPYLSQIKSLRKQVGLQAYVNLVELPVTNFESSERTIRRTKIIKTMDFNNVHKYEDIWRKVVADMTPKLKVGNDYEVQLSRLVFDQVGNRKSYSFKLEFNNGIVANNISGSAVARDLARILESKSEFRSLAKDKIITFKLGSSFVFKANIR